MTLSVVVVTYRRPGPLRACLEAFASQTRVPDEVVVVDNAPSPESSAVCDAVAAGGAFPVRYVPNEVNSLPAARNRGVALSTSEFVAMVDDDVRLDTGYFEAALAVFESHSDAVGVQGYIPQSPRPQLRERLHRIFGFYYLEPDRCRVLPSISTTYPSTLGGVRRCEWISGSNQLYRRSVVLDVPWDERLLKYADGEDLDHSHRVYRRYPGGLYITPDARVHHDASDEGRVAGRELIEMQEVYGLYLQSKLFGSAPLPLLRYLWSRVGRLGFALALAATRRRPSARAELRSLLGAYGLTLRHARAIRRGDLSCFNAGIDGVRHA